ncbi:hypothetical protein [Amycolatopsis orientalis]|uniref:hypothetical protein n=1 Tax=Amycolatopsis orientalis TaxID=31958 RepID=UPI000559F276|nr:hypothetical protein [Amycolatopsis orientalis]
MYKAQERGSLGEFAESELGTELAKVNAEFSRALVEASSLVGDGPPVDALLNVRSLDLRHPDSAVGPAIDTKKGFDVEPHEKIIEGLPRVAAEGEAARALLQRVLGDLTAIG